MVPVVRNIYCFPKAWGEGEIPEWHVQVVFFLAAFFYGMGMDKHANVINGNYELIVNFELMLCFDSFKHTL